MELLHGRSQAGREAGGLVDSKDVAVSNERMSVSFRLRRLLKVLGWGSWRRRRLLRAWRANTASSPEGQVRSFRGDLLALRQATLDPSLVRGNGEGRLCLLPGALKVAEQKPPHQRAEDGWLETAWSAISLADESAREPMVGGLTVLVPRREWANVWHGTVDVYNAYLASRYLDHDAASTRVVFADFDDPNPFQPLWSQISRETLRWKELEVHVCEEVAICPTNYSSPFSSNLGPRPPYLEDFSRALRGPDREDEGLVVVISRAGAVQRNVANEEEVAEAIRQALPQARVVLQRMEELDFQAQVDLASRTSLLVGAHGAGLTHALFLPRHGALLELFPGYLQAFRFHFRNICRWRALPYASWINWQIADPRDGQSVTLPAAKIADQAARLWRKRGPA